MFVNLSDILALIAYQTAKKILIMFHANFDIFLLLIHGEKSQQASRHKQFMKYLNVRSCSNVHMFANI